METTQCIRSLRAVRTFRTDPLPTEALQRIVEAGRWSGSAKNTQLWQFIVVQDRTRLAALAQVGAYAGHLAGAACGLVLVGEPGVWDFDLGRCAQNMMLAAWDEAIGSCITSLTDEEAARGVLGGVPADHGVQTALSLGYPAGGDGLIGGKPRAAVLPRLGRRSLDEVVHWEQWNAQR